MKKTIVKRCLTLSISTLICVSLLFAMGFVGIVAASCGGSSESSYSTSSYMMSWSPVTDKVLDTRITDEKTLIEELNKKKAALETELRDTTLEKTLVQAKTANLNEVQETIKAESEKLSILNEGKSVEGKMFTVSAPGSGGGISGLKAKFSESFKTAPGAGYLSYMISPYSTVNFDQQKAAVSRAFETTQIQYSESELMKSCIEHLGQYMCSQGTNGAF